MYQHNRLLNIKYSIHTIPGKVNGVQRSLKERLTIRIRYLLKLKPSFLLIRHVCENITRDGTVVCQSLRLVIIAFSLMVDEEMPTLPNRNHTIALINTTESLIHTIKTTIFSFCSEYIVFVLSTCSVLHYHMLDQMHHMLQAT